MAVMPLSSPRQARFLNNEVPGINIPDAILRRVERAGAEAPRVGIKIAQELVDAMADAIQGAYIIPSHGDYESAAEVVAYIKAARQR